MKYSLSAVGKLLATVRHACAMVVVLVVLGVAPLFALMLVPSAVGPMQREVLSSTQAEAFLAGKLERNSTAKNAYADFVASMAAKGKQRTALAVVRKYRAEVKQTWVREVAEWIVPTLHARRFDDDYVMYDDYSGYYDQEFDGAVGAFSGFNEQVIGVTFDKDPENDLMESSDYLISCQGSGCDAAPVGTVGRLLENIRDVIDPTVHAFSPTRAGYWQRYRQCVLSQCAIAAAACFLANVVDGEVFWAPCFVAWCGGAELACLVVALFPN